MINSNFYPTPPHVIAKMVKPVYDRLSVSNILEPSAGKGNILDYLVETHRVKKGNIYTVEIEPELQFILAGKGYTVLDSDFLDFADPGKYQIVLMNPPFSDGVDHLLKAWEVVADGGVVVCLLNAETVRNPYTKKRELLQKIIDEHGEATELGQVFKDAERTTSVDVVMVTLNKPKRDDMNYIEDLDFDFDAPEAQLKFNPNQPAPRNIYKSLVAQYSAAAEALRQKHQYHDKYRHYTREIIKHAGSGTRTEQPSLREELGELKSAFWGYVFKSTRLGSAATSDFQEKFREMQQRQSSMAFNMRNIETLLEMLILNHGDILQQCIVSVFDEITRYHEKNIVHVEGWKTNKSWKVGKKIIVPRGITYDKKLGWFFAYSHRPFYQDLDKAICFIKGKRYEDMVRPYSYNYHLDVKENPAKTVEQAIEDHISTRCDTGKMWNQPFESEHFTIRVFKKGTVHLTWRDMELLEKFNIAAANGKNWVGAGY